MVSPESHTDFFRCPVSAENSDACIRVGRCKFRVVLQEASIDGFTALIGCRDAPKIRIGQPWLLQHDGADLEVNPQWLFHSPDGRVQVGLRRLRDLTKPPRIGGWLPSFRSGSNGSEYTSGSMVLTMAGICTFLVLCLPGIGDALGTSARIEQAFDWILGIKKGP